MNNHWWAKKTRVNLDLDDQSVVKLKRDPKANDCVHILVPPIQGFRGKQALLIKDFRKDVVKAFNAYCQSKKRSDWLHFLEEFQKPCGIKRESQQEKDRFITFLTLHEVASEYSSIPESFLNFIWLKRAPSGIHDWQSSPCRRIFHSEWGLVTNKETDKEEWVCFSVNALLTSKDYPAKVTTQRVWRETNTIHEKEFEFTDRVRQIKEELKYRTSDKVDFRQKSQDESAKKLLGVVGGELNKLSSDKLKEVAQFLGAKTEGTKAEIAEAIKAKASLGK